MQRKHLCIAIAVVSLTSLTGCAHSSAVGQSTNTTPVPQALIEAAQQASQARMVYADLQARLNGYSVESVRLDGADAGVPDFMKARVRLDYNGPMMQVMERVASDIGYRVNEYSKPTAGIGWSPWLRVQGDKPLIDHVREMNTQVPWHIVLDHRNQRLVIDYSSDGGMAAQIRNARDADVARRESGSTSRPTLPQAERLEQRAQEATQATLTRQPSLPAREAVREPSVERSNEREQWSVTIEGYGDRETAMAMVSWLSEDSLSAQVLPVGQSFHVQIAATNNSDANSIKAHLDQFGVPSIISVDRVRASHSSQQQSQPAPTPAQRSSGTQQAPSVSRINTNQPAAAIANDAIASEAEVNAFRSHWRVQLSYGSSMSGFGRAIARLADAGIPVYLVPARGNNYELQAGPFDDRASMSDVLARAKQLGFSDAYALSPGR